jgi:4-amino-4-deoxy-L-arabinose transferase-like glycosyltransferase
VLRGPVLRGRRLRGRLVPAVRRHWLVSILLLAGLVLRLLAQIAYRPALLYIDSLKYLYNAWPGTDPVGYKVPLKAILLFGNLETVAALQHLLGLGMAVALYAVLLRRGAARWLAALAVAPVLLDAYQLQIEQTIMPDVWFEALIVAGLALLLWRPRPALWVTVAAGLALGASVTIRQVGEILVLPALIYLVLVAGGWRRAVVSGVALSAAFALPILVYCSVAYAATGHFRLSRSGASSGVYGRMAEAANCATLNLPAAERGLCPTPRQKALGPDGLDHNDSSPLNLFVAPAGLTRSHLVSGFNRAVETQQPLSVLSSWAGDTAKLFAVKRVTSPGDTPIWRWQFQGGYPTYNQAVSLNPAHVIVVGLKNSPSASGYSYQALNPSLGGPATVVPGLAYFLRHYQLGGGYTPGPVYLLAVLAGLIGSLGVARRRARPAERQLALACLLFFTTAAAVLLASDIFEFSWRYQLPALVTLPPAGALGIAVIVGEVRRRRNGRASQGSAGQVPELTAPNR